MLFLAYPAMSLIIGFILSEIFYDRTIIIFCVVGNVLPDSVDTLPGHIIFLANFDYVRIFIYRFGNVLL